MNDSQTATQSVSPETAGAKHIALAVYILYALSLFAGITSIIGVIMAHIKRTDATGTWLESHFSWQIRTFWWGLLWTFAGLFTVLLGAVIEKNLVADIRTVIGFSIVAIGFFGIIAVVIWLIYRIVRGWLLWAEQKPAPIK